VCVLCLRHAKFKKWNRRKYRLVDSYSLCNISASGCVQRFFSPAVIVCFGGAGLRKQKPDISPADSRANKSRFLRLFACARSRQLLVSVFHILAQIGIH